jgi:predicted PurR-regulated permease PerM
VLFFLLVAASAGWAFYSPLRQAVANFSDHLPEYRERIREPLEKIQQQIATLTQNKHNASPNGAAVHFDGDQIFSGVARATHALISGTAGFVLITLTVFIGVIYSLLNPHPIIAAFFGMIPDAGQPAALRVGQRIVEFVPRWALAMVLGMAFIGILVFLTMWLVLGFQDAVVLGLLAFVFEAIPYVGAVLAGIPALLLGSGHGVNTILWIVVSYISIQLIEHNVVSPVIVAGRLRQHPVAVIFSVLFCVLIFGVLGVLLAVPLIAILQILYEELYHPRFLPHTGHDALDQIAWQALSPNPETCSQKPKRPKRPSLFGRTARRSGDESKQ